MDKNLMELVTLPSHVSKSQVIHLLRENNITCEYDNYSIIYNRHTVLVLENDVDQAKKIINSIPKIIGQK